MQRERLNITSTGLMVLATYLDKYCQEVCLLLLLAARPGILWPLNSLGLVTTGLSSLELPQTRGRVSVCVIIM